MTGTKGGLAKSAVDMLKKLRLRNHQFHVGVEAESPEILYRRSLTIPFLDHLENALDDRSSPYAKIAALGLCLVPSVMVKKDDWQTNITNAATLYEADLPAPLFLQTELHCWKTSFQHSSQDELSDSPIAALNRCDNRLFPNISTLLKLVCTIPVTSCEAEQTYSAIR